MMINAIICTYTKFTIKFKDKLADDNISSKKALTVFGIPCPPYFGSQDKEVQPSSIYFCMPLYILGVFLLLHFLKLQDFHHLLLQVVILNFD
jgi:hypothetical protein